MWGVLLVPSSSSPTLSPVYDGLDVNVTSNFTWFYLNHDMVSRQVYKLSFYGGHSITSAHDTEYRASLGCIDNHRSPRWRIRLTSSLV